MPLITIIKFFTTGQLKNMKNNIKSIYYVLVIALSLFSITLAVLDISKIININVTPYIYLDRGILLFSV